MKDRVMSFEIAARLFCVAFLLFVGLAGLSTQTTVPGRFTDSQGSYSYGMAVFLLFNSMYLCAALCARVMWPDGRRMAWLQRDRHVAYIVGGLVSLAPSWYIMKIHGVSMPGSVLYLIFPMLVMFVGACDIKANHGVRKHAG